MKPIFLYFSLAYLFSWLIWFPLYGPHFGIYGLPVLPFHHGSGGFGPLFSAFVTTYIFQKGEGVRQLIRKCLQPKPFLLLAVALLSPFALAIIAATAGYFLYRIPMDLTSLFRSAEFPGFNATAVFAYNVIFFGWGEEVGWRGFALPRFQQHFTPLMASCTLTLFWAVWHWPAFFYRPGYTSMDAAGIMGWLFSLLTGSILLTWLYNSSRGSILICAVFHAAIDIAFTAQNARPEISNLMGMLITVWGILTILIFKPKRLSTISET